LAFSSLKHHLVFALVACFIVYFTKMSYTIAPVKCVTKMKACNPENFITISPQPWFLYSFAIAGHDFFK